MKSKRNPFSILAATTFVVAISPASLLHAAIIPWSGAASSTWATGTNWTGAVAPANNLTSDVAQFNLASYPNQPNAGTTSVAGLQIGDGTTATGALTLSGTSLTLGSSGISKLANSGAAAISSPLVLGAAQSWANTSASTLSISGAVTRNSGAAVNFVPTGTINLTGSGLVNDASGILGGWATVGNGGGAGATADWAALDGSGNIVTYAGYTDVAAGNQTGAGASAQNWRTNNTGAVTTLTTSATINSLVVRSDFSVSSGATATLGNGGLILSGISRWILNNGAGTTAGTGQLTSGLAGGELFVDVAAADATANNWIIWTKVIDNGGTAVKLVKNGPGSVRLGNSNTYTGGTTVNSGTLFASSAGSLGTGAVQVNSGAVTVYLNAGTMANNFTLATGSSVTIDNATNNGTLNGNFGGAGTVTIQNTSAANLSENVNGDWSGFTGTMNYNTAGKVVNIFAPASMDLSHAAVNFANTGNLTNSSFRTSATGTTKFGSLAGFGYLDANGATEIGNLGTNTTFSGLIRLAGGITKVGGGILTLSGANSYTGATTVNAGTLQIGNGTTGSIAAGSAVTIGASGTLVLNLPAAATFASSITDDGILSTIGGNSVTLSGAVNGAGSIVKADAGTLTLGGGGTFSGNSNVSAGKLQVNSLLPGGSVNLGAATLAGNGSVGAVTVNNAAAVLANGNSSSETLTLGSLAFTTGATLNLAKFNDNFTSALTVTGNLTTVSGITINIPSGPVWATGDYNLINYGSFTGSVSHLTKGAIPGLGARQSATLNSTGPTDGSIFLSIAGDSPYWTGAKDNTWTTAVMTAPKNWKLVTGGTTTDFLTNDQVLFNDLATGSTTVNISAANVQVAAVTFDNTSKDYTISSTGGFGIVDAASAASLIKSGDGIVTLNTTNSYTGFTSITAGTLRLGDGTTNGDIAGSSSIANDGTLILNRSSGTFTYGNAISGFGEVIKNGAGTQILAGAATRTGMTTINSGTLQIGNSGLTGSLGSGLITNNASLVFNRTNGVVQGTDFNLIDGVGSVTQAGSGTLTLSSANTYSGGTTVSAGTVRLGSNSAAGSGTITLAAGTTLSNIANIGIANAINVTSASTFLIGSGNNWDMYGNITGSGNITYSPAGNAATLTITGDNSDYAGTFTQTNVANNALNINSATAGSAGAAWVFNNTFSGRTRFASFSGTISFGSLAGSNAGIINNTAGTVTVSAGALNTDTTFSGAFISGAGVIALTKVGTGTLTLTGTNTYTGDTTVNAGVLAVDGDAIANTNKLIVNGGKVDPTGATEVVGTLYFGAAQQASGTWGATGSGATHIDDTHFTGTGVVSVTTGPVGGYTAWADANGATGQTLDQDHDGDGVKNGVEYFMGATGSTFTANPAPVSGTVTWPMSATYTGVYGTDYEVQYSTDLVTWTQAPVGTGDNTVAVTAATSVVYDMPTGGKSFVRLVVHN